MNIQSYIIATMEFFDQILLPFFVALAGFFFIWNTYRYFILGGSNEESQQKARTLAFWGIGAFVFIISLWGIVNLLVEGLELDKANDPITPDYIEMRSTT